MSVEAPTTLEVPATLETLLGTGPWEVQPSTLFVGLLVGLIAGLALGIVFFGGLWLTVREIPRSRQPAVLVVLSFMLRMLLVLAGFFLLSRGGWAVPVAGLLGFLVARTLLIRRVRGLVGVRGQRAAGES